jgi:hypothetical protein
MAKAKAEAAVKPRVRRKKAEATAGNPDTSVLARYSPEDGANSHPEWVKKEFPTYVVAHAGHGDTVVREFTHNGHVVKVTTTYHVEVDGQPIQGHLSVDEDGQVFTHATPFVTYASAVDLMKAVLDAYPDAFADPGSDEHSPHSGHDHHGGRP